MTDSLVARLRDEAKALRAKEWQPPFGAVADRVCEYFDEAADALEARMAAIDQLSSRLDAAEAQNLALIERLESLQFENLKLREAQPDSAQRLLEELATEGDQFAINRLADAQNPDSAQQEGDRG